MSIPYPNKIKSLLILLLILLAATACGKKAAMAPQHLTARQANALILKNSGNPNFRILDVRTPKEFAQGHIAGAFMLDYYSPDFHKGLQSLDPLKTYLIYCRTGNRSSRTLRMIQDLGFQSVYHLQNGIVEWKAQNLPLVTR